LVSLEVVVFWQNVSGSEERTQLMRSEIEGLQVDARYYFVSCTLGVTWYKYEDLKELDDLRRSTTVVGYLPIHLVVLLAIDAAEMMASILGGKEGVNYG